MERGLAFSVLSLDYQRILTVLADQHRLGQGPLSCREMAGLFGMDAVPAKVEALRSKAKRLAVRGCPPRPRSQPARHRQQRPSLIPLRIRHVRRMPPNTLRVIGRVSEPVGDTITRRGNAVELHQCEHVQLRQQGLLGLGWLRNPELPKGPVLMPTADGDQPIETPVRRTQLKIGTTAASEAIVRRTSQQGK
ncbi:hypothetical protein GCM10018966_069090 [Streptomyces yanii]